MVRLGRLPPGPTRDGSGEMGLFHQVVGGFEWHGGGQVLRVEAWGPDAVRVRCGIGRLFDELPGALVAAEPPACAAPEVELPDEAAVTRSAESRLGAAMGVEGPAALMRHGTLHVE